MPVVAILASGDMMPGAPDRRGDAWEGDAQVAVIAAALARHGYATELRRWDDAEADWSAYAAAIVSVTWDYAARADAFVAALERIAAATRLINPLDVIRWNMRKTYLRDMEARGVTVVPTLWTDAATPDQAARAFADFATDRLVIKPQVGAGAWRQVLLGAGDPWPAAASLPPGPAMIQPYLGSVAAEGEYSFIYFGGRFSHGVVKRAAPGDYRIQSSFGGTTQVYHPDAKELAVGAAALAAVSAPLFHARVDLVRLDDGRLALIELELIEPYLYVVGVAGLVDVLAQAWAGLIEALTPPAMPV